MRDVEWSPLMPSDSSLLKRRLRDPIGKKKESVVSLFSLLGGTHLNFLRFTVIWHPSNLASFYFASPTIDFVQ